MAHFAVGFLALGHGGPGVRGTVVVRAAARHSDRPFGVIVRYRTVADRDTVTARTILASQTVSWDDVAGLRFDKGSWAYAELTDGGELRLPAVTFSTLPLLTEASGGRVPNPYGSAKPAGCRR